jgi:hypothetical protein
MIHPTLPNLGELPFDDEDPIVRKILSTTIDAYKKDYPEGSAGLMYRHVHRKPHGLVEATLTVNESIPPDLRVGLFKEPSKSFPALIRFSNGAPKDQPDSVPDVRAAAVKVLQVPGAKLIHDGLGEGSHDLPPMSNGRGFIAKDNPDYLDLSEKLGSGRVLSHFLGWNPFNWRLRALTNLLESTLAPVRNPLTIRYWSQTAYLLGDKAVKYSLIPYSCNADERTNRPSSRRDFLREAMEARLRLKAASFRLAVQLQHYQKSMPVEDPTAIWDERLSPFIPIATIRIEKQEFDTRRGEGLRFSPWHALPELRPLGQINWVRRLVYQQLSEMRLKRNGVIS